MAAVLIESTPPTITCPGNVATVTSSDGTGNCTTTATLGTPLTNDNCSVSSVIPHVGGFPINPVTYAFPIGVTTVNWIVTDNAGNTANCNQTVTVADDENPVITVAPSDQDVNLDASCNFTVPNYLAGVTSSDNCGLVLTQSPLAGALLAGTHNGTQVITITATDAAGLTDVHTFTITYKDITPPVITVAPSDQDVNLDASCNFTLPNYLAGVTASDNCGVVLTQSPLAGAVLAGTHNGTQVITITATDAAGLTDVHTFTITYKDITPPVITVAPSDQDVNLDASCNFTVPNYLAGVTASDNCGLVLTQSPLAGAVTGRHT